jgi:hypothetical protein
MAHMDMAHMDMSGAPAMRASLGPYAAMREASGTAWQPDSAPMDGLHLGHGDWQWMLHGTLWAIANHQSGPRGDDMVYPQGNIMLMGTRGLGDGGRLGVNAMLSADPLMGARGYPLLFATGETADGVTGLVDRQHPHDFVMELAVTLAQDLGDTGSIFVYAGLPGEPALGPPAFMHRVPGMDNPLAPIGHHWMDSTHITFGVLTVGVVSGPVKLEGSLFKGREPDQYRWNFDAPKLDSWSLRATVNPTANLSVEISYGFLKSPEQLEPDENETRLITSATYNRAFAGGDNVATTAAWSTKTHGGHQLQAWLLESDWRFARANTVFGRFERVDNDELFVATDPRAGIWTVNQLTLGYIRDLPLTPWLKLGLGASGTVYAYPQALDTAYGHSATGFLVFARLRLGRD